MFDSVESDVGSADEPDEDSVQETESLLLF